MKNTKKSTLVITVIVVFVFIGSWLIYQSIQPKKMVIIDRQPISESLMGEEKIIIDEFALTPSIIEPSVPSEATVILQKVLNHLIVPSDEVSNVKNDILTKMYEDAPDMRDGFTNWIKICVAESISKNELDQVLFFCQIEDSWPNDVNWMDYESTFGMSSVDDLTATAQVMPYMLLGWYYSQLSDNERSQYYYSQIINHSRAVEEWYGDNSLEQLDPTYQKILDLAIRNFQ